MRADHMQHIIIAGNIGVGKSTLVSLMAEQLGWMPVYELEEANPYLDAYYAEPQRWGFHSQIWFLTRRFAQQRQFGCFSGPVVQDRSMYEDAEVFAASLYRQGILSERDYATYRHLYATIVAQLPPPHLVVYLRASIPTLLDRIAARARPAERAIQAEYLESLEQHYIEWIARWRLCPVLTIDTDDINPVRFMSDREALIERIVQCV